MHKKICALILLSLWETIAQANIAVVGWPGPGIMPRDEDYVKLRDAGFTHVVAPAQNLKNLHTTLDAAQKNGLLAFAWCPELKNQPESVAKAVGNHPALAGYYLADEPSADQFDELGSRASKLKSVDATHTSLVNILPSYATAKQLGTNSYSDHIDRLLRKVPLAFLSFDNYPVLNMLGINKIRDGWLQNLQIIADKAKKNNVPFWAFVLSVGQAQYPTPTLPSLRLQAFTSLAYGAQGIQYFTYRLPQVKGINFHDAPITTEGKTTSTFEYMQQVNRDIHAYEDIFSDAKLIRAFTPNANLGQNPEALMPIESLQNSGPGFIVTLLNKNKKYYVVVINYSVNTSQEIKLNFKPGFNIQRAGPHNKMAELDSREYSITVAPADWLIFQYNTPPESLN